MSNKREVRIFLQIKREREGKDLREEGGERRKKRDTRTKTPNSRNDTGSEETGRKKREMRGDAKVKRRQKRRQKTKGRNTWEKTDQIIPSRCHTAMTLRPAPSGPPASD
jgi:hypothetical protein